MIREVLRVLVQAVAYAGRRRSLGLLVFLVVGTPWLLLVAR